MHTLRLAPESLRRLLLLVSFAWALPLSAKAEKTAPLPVETFFAEPDIRGVQLSPDGKYVAFLTTLGWGKVGIALLDLTAPGKTPEALVSAKDENIKEFFWKGNDLIVYGGDVGGDESYSLRSISVAPPKNGWQGEIEIIFQTIGNLHAAVPEHTGDWYFTGKYPTPGGYRVVNQAYINYYEKNEGRSY